MQLAEAQPTSGRMPGEAGAWVFMLGDMSVFCLFFVTFLFYRGQDVELYHTAQAALNSNIGITNTCLLLLSSWFVVLGVRALRQGLCKVAARLWSVSLLCGIGFAVLKSHEYAHLIEQGFTLNSNDFFMFYFMLTGLHFLHLLIGLTVLSVMIMSTRKLQATPPNMVFVEVGGCYWHMVDLLWILLFPLLYLVQ